MQQKVYKLIIDNQNITYLELVSKINKPEETVRRNIKSLVVLNLIIRVGPTKSGYWVIIE